MRSRTPLPVVVLVNLGALGGWNAPLLQGRLAPSTEDVAALARPVLSHRMALNFAARARGESLAGVIDRVVARQTGIDAAEWAAA